MKKSLAKLLVGLTALMLLTTPVFATPYGEGAYGECDYNCANPAPESPPAEPEPEPEATPAKATFKITLNLSEGQQLKGQSYTLIAKPTKNLPAGGVDPREIGWVSFYIDDALMSTVYSPQDDGSYQTEWSLTNRPGTKVTAVAFSEDDDALARVDVNVTIVAQPAPVPGPTQTKKPTGLIGSVAATIAKVVEKIKEVLQQVPPEVARSFPYGVFIILLVLALRLIWQTAREAVSNKRMLSLLNREKLIAEEKDNFITLSSHYLRTPLALMRNSVDAMSESQQGSKQFIALEAAVNKLRLQIDAMLNDIATNSLLKGIQQPNISVAQFRAITSPFFWVPVISVAGISLLSNFLFGVVAEVDLGATNLLTQGLVFIAVAVFLLAAVRTHHLRKAENEKSQQLYQYQAAIDSARNAFIQKSTAILHEGLAKVKLAKDKMSNNAYTKLMDDGYNRFIEILAKFELLSEIQSGAQDTAISTFSLKDAVVGVMNEYHDRIVAKKLTVNINTDDITTTQNRKLFDFVIRSVIDNAVKFSNEGGVLNIFAGKGKGDLRITVEDNGIGIPPEKMPNLFMPFSRATSALQFDYEGLGFSLFLDKIIMDYLGGDIQANSQLSQGTVVTVTANSLGQPVTTKSRFLASATGH